MTLYPDDFSASPITCLGTIEERLDIVDIFYYDDALLEDITALLRRTQDSQRLAQRFSVGRGTADDLMSLARTIELTKSIQKRFSSEARAVPSLKRLLSRLDIPIELAQNILNSIDEEGLIMQQKIQESETAELVAMAEAAVSIENETAEPGSTTKRKAVVTKETDTSGYFEVRGGIARPEPWLMLRR